MPLHGSLSIGPSTDGFARRALALHKGRVYFRGPSCMCSMVTRWSVLSQCTAQNLEKVEKNRRTKNELHLDSRPSVETGVECRSVQKPSICHVALQTYVMWPCLYSTVDRVADVVCTPRRLYSCGTQKNNRTCWNCSRVTGKLPAAPLALRRRVSAHSEPCIPAVNWFRKLTRYILHLQ
jgi:hypothetical protein